MDSYVARAGLGDASPEVHDRNRSVFIRLIDGGNAENLGVYSLLKRGVGNILISDAASDPDGRFGDLCGLSKRLLDRPDALLPKYLYLPGLKDFDAHCKARNESKGYDMHGWKEDYPVLFGCIRRSHDATPAHASCLGLKDDEVRIFVVKPAIHWKNFFAKQIEGGEDTLVKDCYVRGLAPQRAGELLNCDTAIFLNINRKYRPRGDCPVFPQNSTVWMTANSSGTLFSAYRELARQYTDQAAQTLKHLMANAAEGKGRAEFERIATAQYANALEASGADCRLI